MAKSRSKRRKVLDRERQQRASTNVGRQAAKAHSKEHHQLVMMVLGEIAKAYGQPAAVVAHIFRFRHASPEGDFVTREFWKAMLALGCDGQFNQVGFCTGCDMFHLAYDPEYGKVSEWIADVFPEAESPWPRLGNGGWSAETASAVVVGPTTTP